jgi:ankyrin repeat protein
MIETMKDIRSGHLHEMELLTPVVNGNVDAVKSLLRGVDLRKIDGFSLFGSATGNMNFEMMQFLLDTFPSIRNHFSMDGLLQAYMENGKIEMLKFLIKNGLMEMVSSIVYTIYKREDLEMINFLSKNGVDISKIDKYGRSALSIAMYKDDLSTFDSLLEHGANTNGNEEDGNQDGNSLLLEAVRGNKYVFTNRLLSHGANINAKNYHRCGPLHVAASGGYLDIVKSLLAYGADANELDQYSWTPLHSACDKGCHEVVSYIIENFQNLKLDVKDYNRNTPLIMCKNINPSRCRRE